MDEEKTEKESPLGSNNEEFTLICVKQEMYLDDEKVETKSDGRPINNECQENDQTKCNQEFEEVFVKSEPLSDLDEMFAIVAFIEENYAPAIVSTNWIDRNKSICFYPDVRTERQKNKILLGREDPRPDWIQCPIKLLRECATFVAAKEFLVEAERTYNLASEENRTTMQRKRVRKKRVIILPGEEYSSSDYDDDNKSCQRSRTYKPNNKISKFTRNLPTCSSSIVFNTPTFSKPFVSIPSATPQHFQTLNIDDTSHESHQTSSSGSSSALSSDVLQLKGNQELLLKIINELTKAHERLEKKVDRMLSIMEVHQNNSSDVCTYVEEQFLPKLPMKLDAFDAFEEQLSNEPAMKQRLIKYLQPLGGKDIKAVANNIMKHLFIDEFGEYYSLTGKTGKVRPGKRPFIKTETFQVLYNVCMNKFHGGEESQIREAVSDWLMQSKFRRLRRESRRKEIQDGDIVL